ncbi:GntR family transcriptional regulator [Sphingosinicella sp. LHD-64]|uniref:GntR family transcriptional regulator n=1 Tax=Sphingosinicella sp. LHD-64 TaxID=3072139 RepID=UPI00280FA59D|nr:GntR family transcriptional regulator [Sphingosinicella sp. LHD-64]MDQ8757537.1 GntR family transcriptional regulator [Sphingosinicella sp. LHD-64]
MRGDENTYSRIYRGLRGALARAELAPAAQIRVDETARVYRVSPTPVREALARLVGERLVASSRRHGFLPLRTCVMCRRKA